jgi:hypothetical protein
MFLQPWKDQQEGRGNRHKPRQGEKGQAAETEGQDGRHRQRWTVGRGCNEIGRRPADRGRVGRQEGRT